MGVNRFECRTCPYEAPLDREWFESTNLKQKEVDDIFGGAEEFANADSVASEYPECLIIIIFFFFFWRQRGADRIVQLNAPQKPAMGNVHTSSSCRFVVQMNP